MRGFEPVVLAAKPDFVLVYGDVNSTVAAALVCAKLLVRVGHVEAGLRSFDRSMPEEINRIVTDRLADLLFTPSEDGDLHLRQEGVSTEKIHRVGNVMIDSLIRHLPAARQQPTNSFPARYALVTLHRPSNVDDSATLKGILESLLEVSENLEVVFPVHPRTRLRISQLGIDVERLRLLPPLPYIEFLALQCRAAVVITDSGGIQEETTYLGVPCLTVRDNTERPNHGHLGDECPGWAGSRQTKGGVNQDSGGQTQERCNSTPLGRPCWRSNRGSPVPRVRAVVMRRNVNSIPALNICFLARMDAGGRK